MRVGIVGSRKYRNRKKVEQLVETLIRKHGENLIIVSGGCKSPTDENGTPQNVDVWAERYAIEKGIPVDVKLPNLKDVPRMYVKVVERYYQRNEKIVLSSNIVFVFLVDDSGGAWNTVKWCKKHGVPMVRIYKDGHVEREGC